MSKYGIAIQSRTVLTLPSLIEGGGKTAGFDGGSKKRIMNDMY